VKKACALVNAAEGRLPQWKADAIVRAADETIAGQLDEHYPLYVWPCRNLRAKSADLESV